jgi:hypothetical protein
MVELLAFLLIVVLFWDFLWVAGYVVMILGFIAWSLVQMRDMPGWLLALNIVAVAMPFLIAYAKERLARVA